LLPTQWRLLPIALLTAPIECAEGAPLHAERLPDARSFFFEARYGSRFLIRPTMQALDCLGPTRSRCVAVPVRLRCRDQSLSFFFFFFSTTRSPSLPLMLSIPSLNTPS